MTERSILESKSLEDPGLAEYRNKEMTPGEVTIPLNSQAEQPEGGHADRSGPSVATTPEERKPGLTPGPNADSHHKLNHD